MSSFCTLAVLAVFMLGGSRTSSAQQVVSSARTDAHHQRIHQRNDVLRSRPVRELRAGQNAEFARRRSQPATDKSIFDGDVRNTRINFTFNAGPVLGKWSPRATLEADFFGAFNGVPPFGTSSRSFACGSHSSIYRTAARRCGSASSGRRCSEKFRFR